MNNYRSTNETGRALDHYLANMSPEQQAGLDRARARLQDRLAQDRAERRSKPVTWLRSKNILPAPGFLRRIDRSNLYASIALVAGILTILFLVGLLAYGLGQAAGYEQGHQDATSLWRSLMGITGVPTTTNWSA